MKPFVVGIAGGTASGKSTLAKSLSEKYGISLIGHDRYYHDVPDRKTFNFDHPDSLDTALLTQHLSQLKNGLPTELPVYEFATHRRSLKTETVQPAPVLVVEGILVLADPGLRACFDLKIWVETPADIRLIRRLRRDIASRGRSWESVLEQYEATVRPMHEQWVEPSKAHAELMLDGTSPVEELITQVLSRLP
jgi:uridine kinase